MIEKLSRSFFANEVEPLSWALTLSWAWAWALTWNLGVAVGDHKRARETTKQRDRSTRLERAGGYRLGRGGVEAVRVRG
jgi:hypothetical protein